MEEELTKELHSKFHPLLMIIPEHIFGKTLNQGINASIQSSTDSAATKIQSKAKPIFHGFGALFGDKWDDSMVVAINSHLLQLTTGVCW